MGHDLTRQMASDRGERLAGKDGLHELRLVHTGFVCRDMNAARESLGALFGVHWVGVERENWSLTLNGEKVTKSLRIAHGSTGLANFELIEAVPDTPWVTSTAISQHHLCFYSPDSVSACNTLEQKGFTRVLGETGDPQGYFRQPDGLLVEVIGDTLLAYLNDFYTQSLEGAR
jgi:catechol 2,3-dioxygenase-like lactoylglutathione lyase family enzyme